MAVVCVVIKEQGRPQGRIRYHQDTCPAVAVSLRIRTARPVKSPDAASKITCKRCASK
ncbi:MAG: hypothetical protein NVS3B1_28050 [Marmoricola sp.]